MTRDRRDRREDSNDDEETDDMMEELASIEFPFDTASPQTPKGVSTRKPPDMDVIGAIDLERGWDDGAVTRCLENAMKSHFVKEIDQITEWGPLKTTCLALLGGSSGQGKVSSDLEGVVSNNGCGELSQTDIPMKENEEGEWKPRHLLLPSWAVQPFCGLP